MNINVYETYKKFLKYPFGKQIFSLVYSIQAPYFMSIRAQVNELRPGFASMSMNQRWAVQNHIKTVHAIAVCNLVEATMGLVAEASIPKHLRWLPMGMDIDYLKKSEGKLTATTTIDPETFFNLPQYPGKVIVPLEVKNEQGVVVTKAGIRLWISIKPEKKTTSSK